MNKYHFSPAHLNEPIFFGASRPGYPSRCVDYKFVDEWICAMRDSGITRVVCLLAQPQLAHYDDLLGSYRRAFGPTKVLSAPVADYQMPSPFLVLDTVLSFVGDAIRAKEKTVIHCSAGCGRTGFILAACLVGLRGMSNAEAIATVATAGRDACESGDPEVTSLLDACRQLYRKLP